MSWGTEHHGKLIKTVGFLFYREIPETIISYPKICRVSDIFRLENKTKVSKVVEFVKVQIDKIKVVSAMFMR